MKRRIQARPLDPIMVRDGRPFDNTPGIRAHTLRDVSPSVMAGTVRTMLAKRRRKQHQDSPLSYFSKLPVYGPLYRWRESLYFPLPQDAEIYESEEGHIRCSKVMPCDPSLAALDGQGFFGVGAEGRLADKLWAPLGAGAHKTVQHAPAYVSAEWMRRWLLGQLNIQEIEGQLTRWFERSYPNSGEAAPEFMAPFPRQERTHIAIDEDRGTAKNQHLFSTESLVFPEGLTLETEVELSDGEEGWVGKLDELHTLGGERRLVHFSEANQEEFGESLSWDCPPEIRLGLENQKYIRMVLVTPAFFRKGWQPGWLNEHLESQPLWGTGVRLKLLWANVPRWYPVSGWRHAASIPEYWTQDEKSAYAQMRLPNEKPVRRMVPAGSVYFFEVLEGNSAILAVNKWLTSVSDANRRKGAFDQEDGFGLALWGLWNPCGADEIEQFNMKEQF